METFFNVVLLFITIWIIWKVTSGRRIKSKMLKNGRKYIHPEYPSFTANERFSIHISGNQHHQKAYQPAVGEGVLLKRDPNNRYDSDAIEVLNLLLQRIGWIPSNYNEDLAEELDAGNKIVGQVRKAIPRSGNETEYVIKIMEPKQ